MGYMSKIMLAIRCDGFVKLYSKFSRINSLKVIFTIKRTDHFHYIVNRLRCRNLKFQLASKVMHRCERLFLMEMGKLVFIFQS